LSRDLVNDKVFAFPFAFVRRGSTNCERESFNDGNATQSNWGICTLGLVVTTLSSKQQKGRVKELEMFPALLQWNTQEKGILWSTIKVDCY